MNKTETKIEAQENIVVAMKKLVRQKRPITIIVLASMLKCDQSKLRKNHFDFIQNECEIRGFRKMVACWKREKPDELRNKKMQEFRKFSPKALGIGLIDYSHDNGY